MVLKILCVKPIYPQYSGVLETCLALRFWFFETPGSESVKLVKPVNNNHKSPLTEESRVCANSLRCATKIEDACPPFILNTVFKISHQNA